MLTISDTTDYSPLGMRLGDSLAPIPIAISHASDDRQITRFAATRRDSVNASTSFCPGRSHRPLARPRMSGPGYREEQCLNAAVTDSGSAPEPSPGEGLDGDFTHSRQPRPHRDDTGHLVQAMPAARAPRASARHTKDGLLAQVATRAMDASQSGRIARVGPLRDGPAGPSPSSARRAGVVLPDPRGF